MNDTPNSGARLDPGGDQPMAFCVTHGGATFFTICQWVPQRRTLRQLFVEEARPLAVERWFARLIR